jgi:predicted DNA binding CopG/RHH family protein
MAMSEAQKRACSKYQKTLRQINIRVPKEQLETYKNAAKKEGMTFRSWVISAMESRVVKI